MPKDDGHVILFRVSKTMCFITVVAFECCRKGVTFWRWEGLGMTLNSRTSLRFQPLLASSLLCSTCHSGKLAAQAGSCSLQAALVPAGLPSRRAPLLRLLALSHVVLGRLCKVFQSCLRWCSEMAPPTPGDSLPLYPAMFYFSGHITTQV